MNHGPLIFLGVFFALVCSWWGLVAGPQNQLGNLQQTNTVGTAEVYPVARAGQAQQGAEVYRANGCFYCHSQQVRQTGAAFDVFLAGLALDPDEEPAEKRTGVIEAILRIRPGLTPAEASEIVDQAPQPILKSVDLDRAETALSRLSNAGGRPSLVLVPLGADIQRGWGLRRSVAYDYLFDSPVMLGSQRLGPDLANASLRVVDAHARLLHLYNPKMFVKNSTMPPYPFLFETRRIVNQPSPEALRFPPEFAPPTGYEVVPTEQAHALVAYLISLNSSVSLFEAPISAPPAPPRPPSDQAPADQGEAASGANTQ
jgi:cbb3-type cytochrome oxidase cytochrome c subunit